MPLTLRTNGTGATNLITSDWFNDFYKLFTGQMGDQPITFKPNVTQQAIGAAPGSFTYTLQTGSGLQPSSAFSYYATFVSSDDGETTIGSLSTGVVTGTTQCQVLLQNIPTGPSSGTAKRNLYRSKAGQPGGPYFLVGTINDNTTTTYLDTTPDASLSSTQPPRHSTFGGTLFLKNASGVPGAQINSDGSVSFDASKITSDGAGNMTLNSLAPAVPGSNMSGSQAGSTSGTMAWSFPVWGAGLKIAVITLANFQHSSAVIVTFPSAFTTYPLAISEFTGAGNWSPYKAGVSQSTIVTTALGGTGSGTTSAQPNVQGASMGVIQVAAIDSIHLGNSTTPAANGIILLIGN